MATETADLATLPQVFVSYSHLDETSKDDFLPHIKMLAQVGQLEEWHDRDIGLGELWFDEIVARLEGCAVAILLISANFLTSGFCTREEVPPLLERRRRDGVMLAPILIRPCNWKRVPWLSALQMLPRDGVAISALPQWKQDEVFADVNEEIWKYLETRDAKALARKRRTWSQPDTVDIERLPTSGYDVVGRDKELRLLNDIWDQRKINVISLVAWGGVGKSTLVNKWCEYFEAGNFRGAKRVFGWSFFSQGTNKPAASAEDLIAAALKFFGDPDPSAGSPWAKGERLADLVRQEKSLLILDGLEPLQDPYQGIKDPSVQRLVEELARDNAGLCVITTRESVKELDGFPEKTLEMNVEQISPEAGRALLRINGVRGTGRELEQASRDFGNHALAINLLASYLRAVENHHIQHASEIPDLDIPDEEGRHPRRVMEAFARRFGEGPALDLLNVLGLFDRPASGDCIDALKAPPAIPDLTDHLAKLSEADWLRQVLGLRDLGLIAPERHHAPDELDAHPLVREHFGARLKAGRPEAWRAGHGRLYEHLRDTAKPLPDTLAEMAPLFQAMHHGCQAGRHEEALNQVYWKRILRDNGTYSTTQLGAFGAELAVLADLFDPTWSTPVATLTGLNQALILNEAAFDLRALGRLRQAVTPIGVSLDRLVALHEWTYAARVAGNCSELHLKLGNIAAALDTGTAAITYAKEGNESYKCLNAHIALADACHQAGDPLRAIALLREAEALECQCPPAHPPCSFWAYCYCELLLAEDNVAEVQERAMYGLRIAEDSRDLLNIGLNNLSLGLAALILCKHHEARKCLDQAVVDLRETGHIDELPRGLLARAALFRETGDVTAAERDLDETMRIARRSEMRLFQCDAHLEYARLALAEDDREKAREHVVEARRLVEECGYGRRRPEVEELEDQLVN